MCSLPFFEAVSILTYFTHWIFSTSHFCCMTETMLPLSPLFQSNFKSKHDGADLAVHENRMGDICASASFDIHGGRPAGLRSFPSTPYFVPTSCQNINQTQNKMVDVHLFAVIVRCADHGFCWMFEINGKMCYMHQFGWSGYWFGNVAIDAHELQTHTTSYQKSAASKRDCESLRRRREKRIKISKIISPRTWNMHS